jgi:hypothetical protein
MDRTYQASRNLASHLHRVLNGVGRSVQAIVTDTSHQRTLGYIEANYGGSHIKVIHREGLIPGIGDMIYVRRTGGEQMAGWIYDSFGMTATGQMYASGAYTGG